MAAHAAAAGGYNGGAVSSSSFQLRTIAKYLKLLDWGIPTRNRPPITNAEFRYKLDSCSHSSVTEEYFVINLGISVFPTNNQVAKLFEEYPFLRQTFVAGFGLWTDTFPARVGRISERSPNSENLIDS